MECLGEERIVELLEGRLAEAALRDVTDHLDACAACRALVSDAARTGGAEGPLQRGANVGRYVVLQPVGSGSMGTVYAAWDPELDRKVALKLLRADALGGDADPERLLREGQTLARLSHPNVISVYDLGRTGQGLFIAMEFVEGCTLGEWLHQERRSWREVLKVMAEAAEGLVAAHAAGVVHRDFKPENVLVGIDGRVRVTDFGLAHAPAAQPPSPPADPPRSRRRTRAGELVGTPAYMAPEQLEGKPADARSDQFAFCISLYQAVIGERPRVDRRGVELPPGRRVPGWLSRALARGLSREPDARFPDLRALLDALAAGPRRERAAVAVALLLLAGAATAWNRSRNPCDGERAWGALWSAGQKETVERAFGLSRQPGEAAFRSFDASMAAFRRAWTDAYVPACRGNDGSEAAAARLACLLDARRDAESRVRVLAGVRGANPDSLMKIAGALPSVAACAEGRARKRPPLPADAETRALVEHIESHFAEVDTLRIARYDAGARLAAALLAEAEAIGDKPLLARALFEASRFDEMSPRSYERARQAAVLAVEVGDDETAADTWLRLGFTDGFKLRRADQGRQWLELAGAAIRRLDDPRREIQRLSHLATIETLVERKLADAQLHHQQKLALQEKLLGPSHPLVLAGDDLGPEILHEMGRVDEAIRQRQAMRPVWAGIYGPDSTLMGVLVLNTADDFLTVDRPREALPLLEEALRVWRATGKPDGTWYTQELWAKALRGQEDFTGALAHDDKAYALMSELERRTSNVSGVLEGRGLDLLGLGRAGEALDPLERALAAEEQQPTGYGYEVADIRFSLARALWESGRDQQRARTLAAAAADGYRDDAQRYGSFYRRTLDQIEAWRALH